MIIKGDVQGISLFRPAREELWKRELGSRPCVLSHCTSIATYTVVILTGSLNIFEGNVKLTLGMIWTLIKKYQLRMKGK